MSRCLVRSSLWLLLALAALMFLPEESNAQLRLFRQRRLAPRNCCSLPCNVAPPSCAGAACHSSPYDAQQSRSADSVPVPERSGYRCALYNAGVAGYDENGLPNLWVYIVTDWSPSTSDPQVGVCDGNADYKFYSFNIDPPVCPGDSNPQDGIPDDGFLRADPGHGT
jgi:hypothetical protein